jgi:hypothetical protein
MKKHICLLLLTLLSFLNLPAQSGRDGQIKFSRLTSTQKEDQGKTLLEVTAVT